MITRTGDDPFGEYLHDALRGFGVDDRFVTPVPSLPTPVTFCEIFPPDDFPLYFYRCPKAPDLEIHADELDLDAIRAADVFWVTGHRPVRRSPAARPRSPRCGPAARRGITVLDLDYRPMFWTVPRGGPALGTARRCRTPPSPSATSTSARPPSACASRTRRPRRCTTPASSSPSSSRARKGVLAVARQRTSVEVPPVPVEVVNGLGAGDAFGGALCHGLLAGWDLERSMRFCNAAGAIVAVPAGLRRRHAHRRRGRGASSQEAVRA